MSNLKCPFCQQELVKDTPFAWNCPNEECAETDMMWGTANIWQELIKLMEEKERTRKALDVAVDTCTPYETDTSYFHSCEPVKPDDDIIFKGE